MFILYIFYDRYLIYLYILFYLIGKSECEFLFVVGVVEEGGWFFFFLKEVSEWGEIELVLMEVSSKGKVCLL